MLYKWYSKGYVSVNKQTSVTRNVTLDCDGNKIKNTSKDSEPTKILERKLKPQVFLENVVFSSREQANS